MGDILLTNFKKSTSSILKAFKKSFKENSSDKRQNLEDKTLFLKDDNSYILECDTEKTLSSSSTNVLKSDNYEIAGSYANSLNYVLELYATNAEDLPTLFHLKVSYAGLSEEITDTSWIIY